MIEDGRLAGEPLPPSRADGGDEGERAAAAGEPPRSPAGAPRRARTHAAEAALVALLAAAAAGLPLAGNWGTEFWWNDAARHAMDGVFVLDFVRDLPGSLSFRRYVEEYYARYPCLGLIQYPPFFPVVEAAFFALFGVSMAAARATVAAFAAVGAVFGYLAARRFLGRWGAAAFVLLWATAPGVVYWSRDIMLEGPLLAMMVVSSYFFLRYVEDGRRGFGVAALLALGLAVLTKQTACCLAPAWLAYALWRRGWRVLVRREVLLGLGLTAALLAPFGVATALFSPVNVGQTVGHLSAGIVESRWSLASVAYYFRVLPGQAGVACLAGIAVAVAGAVFQAASGRATPAGRARLAALVYGVLWVGACYGLMTFVVLHKEPRFILIAVPGLAWLGAAGVATLAQGGRMARLAAGLATVLLAGQTVACAAGWPHDPYAQAAPRVSGTEGAARLLADSPPGTVVFYSGNFNGNFIFHMRQLDRARNVVVLRDSKLLYSVATIRAFGFKLHATTPEAILRVLRDCGVRYLVVEDPVPEMARVACVRDGLRAIASSELFIRRAMFPIASSERGLARRLTVYESREAPIAQADVLTIEIAASGRVLRVPFARLGVRTAGSPER